MLAIVDFFFFPLTLSRSLCVELLFCEIVSTEHLGRSCIRSAPSQNKAAAAGPGSGRRQELLFPFSAAKEIGAAWLWMPAPLPVTNHQAKGAASLAVV